MISRPGFIFVALTLLAGCTSPTASLPPPVRFGAPIAENRVLGTFAISPDGQWLAYSAEIATDRSRRIFVRSLGAAGEQDREISGTLGGTNPFFSADSRALGFFARGGLWRVPIDSRTDPLRIADAPVESAGATWTEDGRIVFAPLGSHGLMEVSSAGGGTAVPLTALNSQEGELEHGWPHAVQGRSLVFTVSQRGRDPHVEVLSPARARKRLRVPITGHVQFIDRGFLIYGYLGNLMAVRFDPVQLEISGAPAAVAKGLQTAGGFGTLGQTGFAVSQTGTLVWVRGTPDDAKSRLVLVARDGSYNALSAPPDVYQTPRISPDGRRLAVVVRPGVMTRDIRVLDITRPERILFAVRGGDNQSPTWMDNRRLTFASNRDGRQKIYVVSAGGQPTPLFTADVAAARNPAGWTRPPHLLAFYEVDAIRRRDVLVYRVGESITPAAATNANERSPVPSPDGKWIAYVSDASGSDEVYVKALDGSAEPLQLTSGGAVEPVWTREGVFYREGGRMMLSAIQSGVPGMIREIFEGQFERDPGGNAAAYDVDRRGNFIMLKSTLMTRELRVVQNWTTELVNYLRKP
jgi:eukaryotic-like serine/threonine-protein kinase